jgi:hypothetical protein
MNHKDKMAWAKVRRDIVATMDEVESQIAWGRRRLRRWARKIVQAMREDGYSPKDWKQGRVIE